MNTTIIAMGVSVSLIAGAYFFGLSAGKSACQADQKRALDVQIAAHNKAEKLNKETMKKYYDQKLKDNYEVREVEKQTIKYIKSRSDDPVCLDPDGLRLWNQ